MFKSFPLLVCVAAVASGGLLHAQTSTPGAAAPALSLAMIAPVVDLADLRATAGQPFVYAPGPRADDEGRTAIDHRFAPDGLYGAVGFVCDNDNHPPAPIASGVAAGYQEGRLIGATLRYPFR